MASGIEACLFGHAKIDGLGYEYQMCLTETIDWPGNSAIATGTADNDDPLIGVVQANRAVHRDHFAIVDVRPETPATDRG